MLLMLNTLYAISIKEFFLYFYSLNIYNLVNYLLLVNISKVNVL